MNPESTSDYSLSRRRLREATPRKWQKLEFEARPVAVEAQSLVNSVCLSMLGVEPSASCPKLTLGH